MQTRLKPYSHSVHREAKGTAFSHTRKRKGAEHGAWQLLNASSDLHREVKRHLQEEAVPKLTLELSVRKEACVSGHEACGSVEGLRGPSLPA